MLKRWVNDLGLILLALALALVVWIVAVQEENPIETREFDEAIPIGVENQPPGTTFLPDGFDESVYLTIRAPRSSLDDLRVDTFSAWIDLQDHQAGKYQVPVQAACLDGNVRIIELRPANVLVSLRDEVSRTVPVEVRVFGTPAVGYEFRSWQVTPSEVTVIGPASVVDQSAKATVNLDLRDRRESFSGERRLDIRDADDEIIGFVRAQPAMVQITVPVIQKLDFTEVAVRAVTDGNVAPGYWVQGVTVEPSIITLSGDPSVLREIGGFVDTLPLNISGATGDIVERMPLDLPEQVSPVGVEGVKITVQIAAQQGNVNLLREPIVRGLSTNLEATVVPKEIAVTLTGPLPRIRSLTDEDVFVYADLVDRGVGTHRIELTFLVPEGLQVISVLPEAVEVQIRRILPTPTPTWTPTPMPIPSPSPTGTITSTEGISGTESSNGTASTVTPTPTASGAAQTTPTPVPPALTPTITPTKKPDQE